jgi:ABC-type antimicrobial peptide transport system permease subunit
MVKSDGNLQAAMTAVRQEILRGHPDFDLSRMQPMRQVLGSSLVNQRFILILLGGFAFLSMLLAGVGIYGVMSYLVSQRTREIGIRMALGAHRWTVLGLMLRHGVRLTCAGLVLGLLGAVTATRILTSVLYGTSPTDPLIFAAISLLLAAIALVACFVPACRAANVDPMVALRYE